MTNMDILARTIFGEARGEYMREDGGLSSLIAIGNVVMNRLRQGRYGRTIQDVCLKPLQFSCWNKNDPNYLVIQQIGVENEIFSLCLDVSQNVSKGFWPDLTKRSDHYHGECITPYWAKDQRCRVKIGRHLFYRLE